VGKLFLLEDGAEKTQEYVKRPGFSAYTPNTIRSLEILSKELEKVRKLGFAFDNEEAEKGVSCVGAGIYDDEGRLAAGLSISAPSNRLDRSWGPKVKEVADTISRTIGFRSGVSAA
jgi:DNA-binding IclR family transcriptional regulator